MQTAELGRREAIIASVCAAQLEPGVFIIESGARCGVPSSADATRVLDALPSFPVFYNGTLDRVDQWVAESPATASDRLREHLARSEEMQEVIGRLLANTPEGCANAKDAGERVVSREVVIEYVALHVWPIPSDDGTDAVVYICSGANGATEGAIEDPDPTLTRLGFLTAYYGVAFHELARELSEGGASEAAVELARLPPARRVEEMSARIRACAACLRDLCAVTERFAWLFGVGVAECASGEWKSAGG